MKIRMLGPFGVELEGRPLKLAGPKQRAVLSLLALHANRPVSIDALVDGLWGEEPPGSAAKMVQQYVSQLRRLLTDSGAEILTHGHGYELRMDPEQIDAVRFERLLQRARQDANGDRGRRAREALALWNGAPLTDLREEPFASLEVRRLEELHLAAHELMLEADLDAGRHAEVVPRLQSLIEANPLRERLRALLMLALYRDGRQAEALAAFQEARSMLVEQLGLDPGPELRRLQEAILRHDPELELVVPDRAWASRETVQRVDADAGALTRRRGELRAGERRLADHVLDLQRLQEDAREPPSPAMCPFKGLEAFLAADADLFFGRERLVAEMVARLPGHSLLGVIGPSGSGKSSAVHAGLLPALAFGVLPGSDRWQTVVLRPGDAPMTTLRTALAARQAAADPLGEALECLEPEVRLVLVVDQFEETFTACRSAAQRRDFLDALAARHDDPRYLGVLVLRADFYGACAAHPRLAALLAENHVLVGPLRAEEVREAIERPAQRAALQIEPELVSQLVEETAGRQGALPLLQAKLLELWQRRSGNQLTLHAYEQTGGIDGAVARLAEAAYGNLTEQEAVAARNILLRLAGDPGPGAPVRRQVPLAELDLDRSSVSRRVLETLTAHRLLTLGADSVELAHEALLREWPRLRDWLEEHADARRVHRHITVAAREWDAGRRDAAELYRGARLASALDFAAEHPEALNELERTFLDTARVAGEHEAVRARRMNRRLRALLVGAVAGLLVAGAAGLVALDQRSDARRAATAADAQRLGAEALGDDRHDRALLLARAAVSLDDSAATRASLLSTLLRTPPALLGVFGARTDTAIQDVAVSASGGLVAFGDMGGAVRLYRLRDRRPMGTYRIGRVQRLTFSADGRTLAVTGYDPSSRLQYPVADLVDLGTLRRRLRLALPPLRDSAERVDARVAFASGDRELLVLESSVGTRQPGVLRRYDARTGSEIGRAAPIAADAVPELVLASGGRRVLAPAGAAGASAALRRDGRVLAFATAAGRVRVVDLRTRRARTFGGGHRGAVARLAFTPDGRTLVSSGADGSIVVWDARSGRPRERLRGHTGRVSALAVTPSGLSLLSGGGDGRALLWDLGGARRLVRTIPLGRAYEVPGGTPRGAAISADGGTLAVAHDDGTVGLMDAARLAPRGRLRVSEGRVLGVAFSPDGRLLATSGDAGEVALWDVASRTRVARLDALRAWAEPLAFSPDGRLLASSDVHVEPGRLAIWDVRRTGPGRIAGATAATSLAFSPDGRRLAATTAAPATEIRDVATGRLLRRLRTAATPRSLAFSPDGSLLFVGQVDGAGRFFSTRTWTAEGAPIRGPGRRMTSAGFTRDGRMLFTASADGSVLLWDVRSRRALGPPIVVQRDAPVTAVLAPDGATLYALPTGTLGIRLSTSVSAWKRHACVVAGRELTPREWREALPRHAYRPVCARG